MPKLSVTTAVGRKRKIEEIRAIARFGQFPIPADMSPVDILMDELKRSAGFCFWIETKMSEGTDGRIELGASHYDDKGPMQPAPTNEREWIGIWQAERKHLATVAKMCIGAGGGERRDRRGTRLNRSHE